MDERRIIIGLIASTEFIRRIHSDFDTRLLDSTAAQYIAQWALEYFDQYDKCPFTDIDSIFIEKCRKNEINDELAEEIKEDILPDLSQDFEDNPLNVPYLLKQTKNYIREKRLEHYVEDVQDELTAGRIEKAESLALNYKPVAEDRDNEIDIRSEFFPEHLKSAFEARKEPILKYSGALGDLWNEDLVRGGFIGLLASDKAGKTFMLLDMAMRGMQQGRNIAFFQGGDMTQDEQLMRIGVYQAKRSNRLDSIGEMYEPVKDCIFNQLDQCDLPERESDFGIFESNKDDLSDYYAWYNKDNLVQAYEDNPDYAACHNCPMWRHSKWGAAWIEKLNVERKLEYEEALKAIESFKNGNKGNFKMATYDNGTLSVPMIKSKLDSWEKEDSFYADIILVDYADLLYTDKYSEFRHKQNDIWASLRGLSQNKHVLIVVPTQADANAYSSSLLKLSNFSEDKRKYSHVTAMFGLNRDTKGVEKRIGLMRINELLKREGDYDNFRQVKVIQNLKRGRPVISSFW